MIRITPEGWSLKNGLNIYPPKSGHYGGRIKLGERILYARYSTYRKRLFVEYHSPDRDWQFVFPH